MCEKDALLREYMTKLQLNYLDSFNLVKLLSFCQNNN